MSVGFGSVAWLVMAMTPPLSGELIFSGEVAIPHPILSTDPVISLSIALGLRRNQGDPTNSEVYVRFPGRYKHNRFRRSPAETARR